MLKTLKEEMRNSLKKWRKRQTKNWKTLANPLEKTKKSNQVCERNYSRFEN